MKPTWDEINEERPVCPVCKQKMELVEVSCNCDYMNYWTCECYLDDYEPDN
jgi:hypothetical protein